MQKLILLSVIIATFVIPVALRDRGTERRTFQRVLSVFVVFTAVYVFLILFVYPRLG